jgi:hypothetical protein
LDASQFKLLTQRSILDIFDGDTDLFEEGGRQYSMPYLSGPKLVELSNWLGFPISYQKSGPSRWMYLRDLMEHCIERGTIQNLLSTLFGKASFADALKGFPPEDADRLYSKTVEEALRLINGQLYFSGVELAVVGTKFMMRDADGGTVVEVPMIESVNQAYVRDIAKRGTQDALDGNYDSAITKARTLLEEAFCYAIEARGHVPSDKGKINELYKQVKDLYNMHADAKMDVRVNKLLSGLEKIVSSIGEMRNESGDSHGMGQKRIAVEERHAMLAVNSAATMAEFILAVVENAKT